MREMYANDIVGQSRVLARRLTEAGVPIVQVCCAAGDLKGATGDVREMFSCLTPMPTTWARTPLALRLNISSKSVSDAVTSLAPA